MGKKTTKTQSSNETERKFFTVTEDNDWEGEKWNFCFPKEGNEEAMRLLEKYMIGELLEELPDDDDDDDYAEEECSLSFGPNLNESEVNTLVKNGGSGYMDYWNKVDAVLDIDKLKKAFAKTGSFYKGGIKKMVKAKKKETQ